VRHVWALSCGVAAIAALTFLTWWLIEHGTRGAEIATVITVPLSVVAAMAGVLALRPGKAKQHVKTSPGHPGPAAPGSVRFSPGIDDDNARRRSEEVNDHPPVIVDDLHGLDGDQIQLLRDSVAALRDLLTVAEEAKRTSLLSQKEFADVSARMQGMLNRTEAQLLALKGSVTLLKWPDREWAARVITAREKAERELKAAERWNRFGVDDQQHPWPRESVAELLGLLEQYSGLFTTEH
jgi:hypothetical protein